MKSLERGTQCTAGNNLVRHCTVISHHLCSKTKTPIASTQRTTREKSLLHKKLVRAKAGGRHQLERWHHTCHQRETREAPCTHAKNTLQKNTFTTHVMSHSETGWGGAGSCGVTRTIVEHLISDERDASHPQSCIRQPIEPHRHACSRTTRFVRKRTGFFLSINSSTFR